MIETPRLRLVQATPDMLRAELANDTAAFCALLAVATPPQWPPDLYDAEAVAYALDRLEREPLSGPWSTHYATRKGEPATLIGALGYKGPPHEGYVEIGYSVVESERRKGYASEAVTAMIAHAFGDLRVNYVIAHTLPELVASIGVLKKAGFRQAEPSLEPGAIMFMLERGEWERATTPPQGR